MKNMIKAVVTLRKPVLSSVNTQGSGRLGTPQLPPDDDALENSPSIAPEKLSVLSVIIVQ